MIGFALALHFFSASSATCSNIYTTVRALLRSALSMPTVEQAIHINHVHLDDNIISQRTTGSTGEWTYSIAATMRWPAMRRLELRERERTVLDAIRSAFPSVPQKPHDDQPSICRDHFHRLPILKVPIGEYVRWPSEC